MTDLERTWRLWKSLSRADRARFLVLLRETPCQEREATMVRRNGGEAIAATSSSLRELTLTEADLQRRHVITGSMGVRQ
jgi:hypothetical protein